MKKYLFAALSVILACSMLLGLAACQPNTPEEVDTGSYTYNYALQTFPTNWNPHTYQTATDAEILDYIIQGFYTFDYNDTEDGYKLVPAMATAEPVDVTSEYIGKYGLVEGDTARAYKISLRDDIKWEDGTAIKAADFVKSAKLLLDPTAQNYRADSLYSGNLVITNSEQYLKQGQDLMTANSADGEALLYNMSDFVKGADGAYTTPDGVPVYFGLTTAYAWMSNASLYDYSSYIPTDVWTTLTGLADDDGLVAVTDESIAALYKFTGSETWGNELEEQLAYYISFNVTYPELSWDDVGIFASGENELTIVLEKQLEGFYLLYSLTDSWLVNETLYNSLAKTEDGVYSNTYGTSVDTTMSYGPYKLTSFQSDKIFTFEKNSNWYGYNDKANKGLYKTTNISVEYVPEASTRLEMFLNGKLDTYGLQSDDMETYSKSDYTYYTTGDSTFFMAFNPDFDALANTQSAGTNKTILTIAEFRMAMSFALDRAAFCLATSPTNNAAFALYSGIIIADPDTGTAYRTTDQAKQVVANFWNLTDDIGEGKLYATIDDAIESLTGYNLTKAQTLFDEAYDKAIAAGYLTDSDVIEIKIGTPNNTSNFYNRGYEFIVNNYTEAVKGTKLEGKLTFTRDDTLGNGFSAALKNNQVDMLFGVGWTGSALDPYNLMEAYTSNSYQYDPSWDTTTAQISVTVNGISYKASVWDWTKAIMGESIVIVAEDGSSLNFKAGSSDDNQGDRLNILAALENAVLETYDMIPIMDDSSANLKGMQIKYHTEDYIYGVGRGGIKYMTYNYNDDAWNAYVTEQGGTLNYK